MNRKSAGAALMKEPELAARIIRAVKSASPVPVTVKFRKGWDEGHINAVEFARMAQESGADAITVHGRTRAQMYAPPADWDILRQVKAAVSIPVIGNGDVDSPQKAKAMGLRVRAALPSDPQSVRVCGRCRNWLCLPPSLHQVQG